MKRRVLLAAMLSAASCSATPDTPGDVGGRTSAQPVTAPARDAGDAAASTALDAADDADDGDGDGDGDGNAPDSCDSLDRARLVRSQSIPGGHRVYLHLTDPDGEGVLASAAEDCLQVASDRVGVLDVAASEVLGTGGATLLVARWSPDEVEASREVVDELLVSLPAGERVAVWAWSDELVQVVGATTDRGRIARRLDAVWSADDALPLEPEAAAEVASEEWEDYAEDALLGIRSVVFVAPGLDLGERPDIDRDVVVDHWIVGSGVGPRVIEVGANEAASPGRTGGAVGARIARDGAVPLTVVEFCDDGGPFDLTLSAADRELRDFGVGGAAAEHRGAACSVEAPGAVVVAQDAGTPPPVRAIVSFDDTQRATFAAAVAVADGLTGRDRFDGDVDPEWTGSLSLDDGRTAAPFEASFRGQSSIECERRNWSVDLEGGDARHPVDGSGTDEFLLASLCNDSGYVNTLIGSAVMSQFDAWTQATGTAVFEVDGENRGVYLIVEDPDTDLRVETSRVRTVLRRRYDAIGVGPDVEFVDDVTSDDETSVLATYDDLVRVASSSSGDEMIEELRARLDLDQYLRWTAVMSLLGSGDHIDEVYFVGSESVDAQHEPITWFTVNGWDPDDLYAPCHRDGRLQIDDPDGLLSCTESLLDQQLFADPVLYELYAEVLADVIAEMTTDRFREIATASAADVTSHFADQAVVDAMVGLVALDPAATTPTAARAAVDAETSALVNQFDTRRSTLLDLLDAYQNAN